MRQRKHNARRIFAWSIILFGSYGFEMTGLSVQIVSLNRTSFVPRHSRNGAVCGAKFDSQAQLEDHVKSCTQKKNQELSARPLRTGHLTAIPQGAMRTRIGVEN